MAITAPVVLAAELVAAVEDPPPLTDFADLVGWIRSRGPLELYVEPAAGQAGRRPVRGRPARVHRGAEPAHPPRAGVRARLRCSRSAPDEAPSSRANFKGWRRTAAGSWRGSPRDPCRLGRAIRRGLLARRCSRSVAYGGISARWRAQASGEIHHPAHRSRRTAKSPAYYGAYAFSPGYYSNYAYNPWSRSRSLNHGQGPGCIQSPASLEYTGCD